MDILNIKFMFLLSSKLKDTKTKENKSCKNMLLASNTHSVVACLVEVI